MPDLVIPAATARLELVHERQRTFRWMFLLELALAVVCCVGWLPLLLLAVVSGGEDALFDPVEDLVGRMWRQWHHVRLDGFDADGNRLQSIERVVDAREARDEVERMAFSAAADRDLPLVQRVLGQEIYRSGGSLEPVKGVLQEDQRGVRWTEAPGWIASQLERFGLHRRYAIAARFDQGALTVETALGPWEFPAGSVLAVRWGPVLSVGKTVVLRQPRLHIVGTQLTASVAVPDARVGAALASFIQRGIREG